MAIIQNPYGGGVLIGSIGSTTFQRGRFGNLARARTKPVNPNTLRQQTVKSLFTQASDEFDTLLTSAERDGWTSYALNTPVTGPKGTQIHLTGRQMWMRSRVFQLLYSGGPLTTPPSTQGVAPEPVTLVTYTAATGAVELTAIVNVPTTYVVNFLVSRNLKPSRNYWKGPFNQTNHYLAGETLPFAVATIDPTGDVGDKIFVRTKLWDADDNKISYEVIFPVIAT